MHINAVCGSGPPEHYILDGCEPAFYTLKSRMYRGIGEEGTAADLAAGFASGQKLLVLANGTKPTSGGFIPSAKVL